jgi:hypothetical protein
LEGSRYLSILEIQTKRHPRFEETGGRVVPGNVVERSIAMHQESHIRQEDQVPGATQQNRWQLITHADVKRIQKSRKEVADILRKRYGYTRQQAEVEISAYLARMMMEVRGTGQPE